MQRAAQTLAARATGEADLGGERLEPGALPRGGLEGLAPPTDPASPAPAGRERDARRAARQHTGVHRQPPTAASRDAACGSLLAARASLIFFSMAGAIDVVAVACERALPRGDRFVGLAAARQHVAEVILNHRLLGQRLGGLAQRRLGLVARPCLKSAQPRLSR